MNWKIGDLVYVRKDVIAETKEAQEVLKQEPGVGMIISITPLALTAKLLDDALNGPDATRSADHPLLDGASPQHTKVTLCEVYLTSLRCVRFLDYQLGKL